jgi:hypothetical protein
MRDCHDTGVFTHDPLQEDIPMRQLFDDFDEFDFDDNPSVARLLREQRLEESRFASRKSHGPKHKRQLDDDNDYDDFEDYDEFDDFDNDFDDYNEREFDSYAGIGIEH